MPDLEVQDQMFEQAKAELLATGLFAAAEKIAQILGEDPRRFTARVSAWKADREIFSIADAGRELFPVFVFERGEPAHPCPAVAEVLSIFGDFLSNWSIAAWFVGLNSYLDDQCPKDLLDCDPAWVIESARDQMSEISRP